jgi:hypothetical protein
MSKLIAVLISLVLWYNLIAFVMLEMDFTEWHWLTRAFFVVISAWTVSTILANELPKS